MPIDWKKFDKEIDEAVDNASKRTDAKLASKISSVTRLTDEEIVKLFPKPADVAKLKDLMKIVKSSDSKNKKINKIVQNAETFGGIIVTLLKKFA